MSVQPFSDEECIVVKGEIGESFFILKEGVLDVFVKMGEKAAHTYTCSPSAPCPSFGELAIMFASKRKATVKGRGNGCVWCLPVAALDFGDTEKQSGTQRFSSLYLGETTFEVHEDHQATMKTVEQEAMLNASLGKSMVAAHLDTTQFAACVRSMHLAQYHAGDIVFHQGSFGRELYIVESGCFEARIEVKENADKITVATYTVDPNSVFHPSFGDLSILFNKPRSAQLRAVSNGALWSVTFRGGKTSCNSELKISS